MTVDELERTLREASRRLSFDADLEAVFDRVESEIGSPRPVRHLGHRLAVAALALLVAGAGTVVVVRALRQPNSAGGNGRSEYLQALWPEWDRGALDEAQAAVDQGEDQWRLGPGRTARRFGELALLWPKPLVVECSTLTISPEGCPRVLARQRAFILTQGWEQPPCVGPPGGCEQLPPMPPTPPPSQVVVTIAQLGRTGEGGIWSVIRVDGSDLQFEVGTGSDVELQSDLSAGEARGGPFYSVVTIAAGHCVFSKEGTLLMPDGAGGEITFRVPPTGCSEIDDPNVGRGGYILVARVAHLDGRTDPFANSGDAVYRARASDAVIYDMAAVPVAFIPGDGSDAKESFLGTCPNVEGTLPAGPERADEAEAFIDAQDPEWGILGSGAGWEHGFATTECGVEVARRTWIVTTYPLAQPDSASLPIDLYLVRRASGWEVWGSY